jgi:hypothetical protein
MSPTSALIAIDPGPHTGIAVWFPDTDTFNLQTLDFTTPRSALNEDPHATVWEWLHEHVWSYDVLVCEKFEYDRDKAQNAPHLDYLAAELVGVVKLFACQKNVHFCYQTRGAVGEKAFWDNDKLRRLGLLKGGRTYRHEMDALRHLLYHYTFCMKQDYWLKKVGGK